MRNGVEEVFNRIRSSLEGTDVLFIDIVKGVATIQYYKPLSGSNCHRVIGSSTKKEMKEEAIEIVREQLKKEVPEVEEVITL